MESKFTHDEKQSIANRITRLTKKQYIIDIFKIIKASDINYTENENGVFLLFNKLDDHIYDNILTYLDKCKKKSGKNDLIKKCNINDNVQNESHIIDTVPDVIINTISDNILNISENKILNTTSDNILDINSVSESEYSSDTLSACIKQDDNYDGNTIYPKLKLSNKEKNLIKQKMYNNAITEYNKC